MDIDRSHTSLSKVASSVARNPAKANRRQLRSAMRYLSYRRAQIILSARRRGVAPLGLEKIAAQLSLYAELLNGK